jgi:hypothetical protein
MEFILAVSLFLNVIQAAALAAITLLVYKFAKAMGM